MSVLTPAANAAVSIAGPPLLTAEEFVEQYEGQQVELVNGVVMELPMAYSRHGQICVMMIAELLLFFRDHDFWQMIGNDAWIRLRRDPDVVRGPDVAVYRYDRMPKGPVPDGLLDVIPDLVVEVVSPSDRWTDVFGNVQEYLGAGVRAVVVLDNSSRTASVYRPPADQVTFHSADTLTIPDVLPGFAVPVARLFG